MAPDPHRLSRQQRTLMRIGWLIAAALLVGGLVLLLVRLATLPPY